MKTVFGVGVLLVVMGAVVAVATWPDTQSDALGDTRYGSALRADLGVAAAMLGLLLVLLASIAFGMRRLESINQENKP